MSRNVARSFVARREISLDVVLAHVHNGGMKTIDMGNNETVTVGVVKDGATWTALTFTQSKTFKTEAGAEDWLARRGYAPNGEKLS